eukprot:3280045-Rhodomonas_salina.2
MSCHASMRDPTLLPEVELLVPRLRRSRLGCRWYFHWYRCLGLQQLATNEGGGLAPSSRRFAARLARLPGKWFRCLVE